MRTQIPDGKLNIRHRQMRNVFQVFAGREYLPCGSGDTPEEAIKSLSYCYDLDPDSDVTVHGYKSKMTVKVSDLLK